MKIKIEKFYQDLKGHEVKPGEYDASELPNGLADYLVNHGHASVIEEPKSVAKAETKPKK